MKNCIKSRLLLNALTAGLGLLLAPCAQAQFQWANRIASANNWPEGEPNTGLVLDTNDNCYMTGFFDDTNNFGGVTLTNQSTGGSDIFVAKYNSAGALQWAQRAGGGDGNFNYGRGIGTDTNGNIYVTGGYQSPATFGSINLPATSGEEFFLAKYNNAGAVQWVQPSTGGSDDVYGIGLTVDGAGNSYALVVVDDLGGAGALVTFGSTTVTIPASSGDTVTILVKYDNTGNAQWAKLLDSSDEVYATKVAVDAAGNVYVRGIFYSNLIIGTTNVVGSDRPDQNAFIAKFNNLGALTWVQAPQTQGGSSGEGGVAVDLAGNVFVSGYFDTNLVFGGGITLTNKANSNALFGDAFLAKYNSSGAIQWAQAAGGTNGGFYWDLALDAQTNVYAAGFLGSDAAVAKYSSAGTLQWTYSASGPPASPVASGVVKCAVDSAGHCYLNGFYQGTATFGTNTLQPQETWNFFLTEVGPSNTMTSPTIQFTASPTSGTPPLAVQFNSTNVDSLGNAITSWKWNFGDGATSILQNPSHIYTNIGSFTPTLLATNNNGVAVIGSGPQIVTTPGPPSVTLQPTNSSVTVTVGNNFSLSVSVAGTGPFSYQWQLNGTNLPNGIITTVAGNGTYGYSGDGGAATNANINDPYGAAVDASGNLFIADIANNVIRKVDTNGIITTVAGGGSNYPGDIGPATNAELIAPSGVAVDASGNLFIGSLAIGAVRKVDTNGIITTVAGGGTPGYSGDGGLATSAALNEPSGVAVDATGNLFIADLANNVIRKVDTNGIITTVAGNGTPGYSGDGDAATNAELNYPFGVAVDASDNLFIADQFNNVIRKVGTNGIIVTVAGDGMGLYSGDGGVATNAELFGPSGVAVDASGNLFIAEQGNNDIREVDANGIITTVAGNRTYGYSGDGGAATNAELNDPFGVAVDASGNVFIADSGNDRIRKVFISGPTLVLNDVNGGNTGAYDVVVSSPYGSVTSSVVNVTVTIPLMLSAPQITVNKTNFNFLLSGPVGSNYVLQVSTNLLNWSPVSTSAIPVGGSINLSNAISGFNRQFYRAYLK